MENRSHPRLAYEEKSLTGAFRLADGSYGEFRLQGRNISRGGVSVLSERMVDRDTLGNVMLPTHSGEMIAVRASVRRCRPVEGGYELGIKFDESLDRASFKELVIER